MLAEGRVDYEELIGTVIRPISYNQDRTIAYCDLLLSFIDGLDISDIHNLASSNDLVIKKMVVRFEWGLLRIEFTPWVAPFA